MSRLEYSIFKLEDGSGEIRVTPGGRPSIFDMIRVLGGKKNPKETWKRIAAAYPEVVTRTDYFHFPGRGQRETPVASSKVTEQAASNQLRLAKRDDRLDGNPGTYVRESCIEHIVETTARYLHGLMEGNTVVPGL